MPEAHQPADSSPHGVLRVIGGFELIEKIGQGGMGTVFKAQQQSLERIVALKILPPSIAKDNKFILRFQREARASAQLNHPNIVLAIDVGKDEATGLWYFAMEYVDGLNLRQVLKEQKKIPEQRALEIVRDIAHALECAQKHGIVHRDIKPDNILLTSRGAPKLADLGLAKQITNDEDASLTQSGKAIGTPFYMAPEQIRGLNDQIGVRTDLYALGATLFHLVTGQRPFEGNTSAEVMAKHLTERPPLAHRICKDVSEPCSRLIEKMMQKLPEQRVQTPQELVKHIDRILKLSATSGMRTGVRGHTTGPRQPVGNPTTGKVSPVRSDSTGPRKPVGDRDVVLNLAKRKPFVIAGVAMAIGLAVVFILIAMVTSGPVPVVSKEPAPIKSNAVVVAESRNAVPGPVPMVPPAVAPTPPAANPPAQDSPKEETPKQVFEKQDKKKEEPVAAPAVEKTPLATAEPAILSIAPAVEMAPTPVSVPGPASAPATPSTPALPVAQPAPAHAAQPEDPKVEGLLEFAELQKEFLELARKGDTKAAAEKLAAASQKPSLKAFEQELLEAKRALVFVTDLERAFRAGLEQLKEVDEFELELNRGGPPMRIGKRAEFQVVAVHENRLEVGRKGMAMPIAFNLLHVRAHRLLVDRGLPKDGAGHVRRAFNEMLFVEEASAGSTKPDAARSGTVRTTLARAQGAGADPAEVACLFKLLEVEEQARRESAACAAWLNIEKLVQAKPWVGLAKAAGTFMEMHGTSRIALAKAEALKKIMAEAAEHELPSQGLVLWLRADLGLKHGAGNAVAQWSDCSGKNHHAAQSSPERQPLWVKDAHAGRPALRFDGKDDHLVVPGISGPMKAFSLLWTLKPAALGNCCQALSAMGGWGQFVFHGTKDGGVYIGTNLQSRMNKDGGVMTAGEWQSFAYLFDENEAKLFRDGQLIVSKKLVSAPWSGFRLGIFEDGAMNGDLSELMIFDRVIDEAERVRLEQHLGRKADAPEPAVKAKE